jgi:spermidine/putrescine transport system ATP-binding protein
LDDNATIILEEKMKMDERKKIIEFKHIVKNFGDAVVLKGIDLDIYENEFVTLLGPSGCGKTTLLRILGGFLEPNEGQVILDGEDIKNVPPYKRELNTVFQRYALFPHMNVYDNIAFGLKIKKMSKDVIDQKVMRMLKLIGLEGFEKKDVTLLSGGQQQRVAIARALVNEPKVLLLDEPLSALDHKLRKEMQYELKRIQQEVGITFIFVTHDQEEALTMSDKIVVMNKGEIQQVGSPEEIYNEPVNRYVAQFIGESNIVPAIMLEDEKVKFDDTVFDCVDKGFKDNERVDVIIRPEDIDIVPVEKGKMTGEVLSVLFKGVHYEIMVETVPGTTVSVNMHIVGDNTKRSEDGKEMISANDFYLDLEDMEGIDDKEIIARAGAQAWNPETDEFTSIAHVETDLKQETGEYHVTFSTSDGLEVTRKIWVIDQRVVENKKANEAISAFNFFKTADEIAESQALDTDLKVWANAQAWKLDDEDENVELFVDYDFDPENLQQGIYKVTFSTTGREFKIHTTDYVEEGKEVGLTFNPEDIHVMEKMGF